MASCGWFPGVKIVLYLPARPIYVPIQQFPFFFTYPAHKWVLICIEKCSWQEVQFFFESNRSFWKYSRNAWEICFKKRLISVLKKFLRSMFKKCLIQISTKSLLLFFIYLFYLLSFSLLVVLASSLSSLGYRRQVITTCCRYHDKFGGLHWVFVIQPTCRRFYIRKLRMRDRARWDKARQGYVEWKPKGD